MSTQTYHIQALPYEFSLRPESTALLVIDMQRDFVLPGGFGETLGNNVKILQEIIPTVSALLAFCRSHGIRVIHTREGHTPSLSDLPAAKRDRGNSTLRIGDHGPMGRILVRGEYGHDIIEEAAPLPGEIVIDKPGKGSFYNTALHDILRDLGITTLLVAGVTTEVCVQTTMREANDRGYNCLLIEDATASYFPEFKAATLAMIRAQGGIVGWTTPFETLQQAFL
jgi:nicotinamidase-related amidase